MANKPKQRSTAPPRQQRNRMAPPKGGARPTRSKPEQRTESPRGNLNRIGALWLSRNRTRQGDRYMTGRIEFDDNTQIRLMVFKNGYKQEERHPDYIIYEPEQTEQTANRDAAADDWNKGKGKATHDSDDIPF